jgi:hypothetical protein
VQNPKRQLSDWSFDLITHRSFFVCTSIRKCRYKCKFDRERLLSLYFVFSGELHDLSSLTRVRIIGQGFPSETTLWVHLLHVRVYPDTTFTVFKMINFNSNVIAQHLLPNVLNYLFQCFLHVNRWDGQQAANETSMTSLEGRVIIQCCQSVNLPIWWDKV